MIIVIKNEYKNINYKSCKLYFIMCDSHPNVIFDDDIIYLTKEMIRLYGPYESHFGCNHLDYLVSAWVNA